MSLWTEPDVPKEMPCEKCGQMTLFNGLMGAGRVPCVHCGAPRPHTPLRTGRWPTIFLMFFVGVIPVALLFGEGAIGVIFPLFLLLFLVMVLMFIAGCIYRRWKGKPRSFSLSFLIGILVAAGALLVLRSLGSGPQEWMSPVMGTVVVALIFSGALFLFRFRILDQSEDPVEPPGKARPEKSDQEE